MKANEIAFFESVNKAMAKCPRVASGFGSPTAAVGTYVKAYSDFSEVVRMGTLAISKYLEYKSMEKHLKNPDVEREWVEQALADAYHSRDELTAFVELRAKAGWQ